MVRLAPYPYTRALADEWIATHAAEREAGTAFRLVIEKEGMMVGVCDVDEIADGTGDLGYWLDESVWGLGIATEAARAVVAFGFDRLGLKRLTSGHAADNAASGRILAKLGFRKVNETRVWSNARGCEIEQWKYERSAPLALR